MTNIDNKNFGIIPHRSNCDAPVRILLVQEAQRWSLPSCELNTEAEINKFIREQFGLMTTVLYIAYDHHEAASKGMMQQRQRRVYVLENHSPDVKPHIGQWFSRTEIASLDLLIEEHRPVIEAEFDEMEYGVSSRRLPWMYSGWFDNAVMWIREQLAFLGYTITGEVEQVKVRTWSTVMSVSTDRGLVYFKAVPSFFAYEPSLTQKLGQIAPTHSPVVLAVDEQRLWLLLLDAGKVVRGERDPEKWRAILTLYAEFQMQTIPHIDSLLASRCPDLRLSTLPHSYEKVLEDHEYLLLDRENGLPMKEYRQLLSMTPQVKEMCANLASYGIPESLHHDDLHGGNVLWNGTTYIFFDWSDSAITHPFLSLFTVLRSARYFLDFDEETRESLVTVYLTPWTRYAPMNWLREALAIAHRLGAFSRAVTWYRVLKGLAPLMREEYEDSVAYYLRVFLGTEE